MFVREHQQIIKLLQNFSQIAAHPCTNQCT